MVRSMLLYMICYFFIPHIGLDNYPKTGRNVVQIFYCYFLPLDVLKKSLLIVTLHFFLVVPRCHIHCNVSFFNCVKSIIKIMEFNGMFLVLFLFKAVFYIFSVFFSFLVFVCLFVLLQCLMLMERKLLVCCEHV